MRTIVFCLLSLSYGVAASAGLEPAPGFSAVSNPVAAPSSFIGGLCKLPNGDLAIFDGNAVVAIDAASGAVHATLYTPAAFVFGSFLVADPSGGAVYFGESSLGTITKIPLSGGGPSLVAVVALNYDAAFDSSGNLFVTRGTPSFTTSEIVRVDLLTGSLDLVATVSGPSGPLAFDVFGNLYYGENSPHFPAPLGSGTIWTWFAAQVQGALGPSSLTFADGIQFAPALDAISEMEFDADGDLLVCDSIYGRVYELNAVGFLRAEVATVPSGGATYLALVEDSSSSPARFDPFQPPAGGALAVVASDFQSFNDVALIRPQRAKIVASPASPLPVGPFTLDVALGSPNGLCFLFAAISSQPEVPLVAQGIPFFFALAPGSMVFLGMLPLDANGDLSLPVSNPGLAATVTLQGALFGLPSGPLGTTTALDLVLQ